MANNGIVNRIIAGLITPILTGSPGLLEAVVSLSFLWFGFVFIVHCLAGTFTPLSAAMSFFLPQLVWAIVFLGIGFGIGFGKVFKIKFCSRFLMFICAGLLTFMGVQLFLVIPYAIASGMFLVLALGSMWAFWRLKYV